MDAYRNFIVHLIPRCVAYFLLVFIFISPYIIEPCLALYEDQVGKFDWRQQYIGAVRFVHFDYSSSGRKIIVASDQNVIAAVNPSTSQIIWRQLLEPGAMGTIHVLAGTTEIICVSGIEALVRSWDPATGRLNWETSLSPSRAEKDADRADVTSYAVDAKKKSVTVVEGFYSRFVRLRSHDLNTGKVVSTVVETPWFNDMTSCGVVGTLHFVCVALDAVYSLLLEGASSFSKTSFPNLPIWNDVGVEFVPSLLQAEANKLSLFALRSGGGRRFAVFRAIKSATGAESRVEFVANFDEVYDIGVADVDDATYVFLLSFARDEQQIRVRVFDLTAQSYVDGMESSFDYSEHYGDPSKLFVHIVPKRDGGYGFRLLLCTEAHSLLLMQPPGRVVWVREEALASVVNVEMVDLPVSESDARVEEQFDSANENVLTMFGKRLATQLSQVQKLATQLVVAGLHGGGGSGDATGSASAAASLVRDEFNIHKVAVLVTAVGKIFGVDSLSGAILWRRYLKDLAPFDRYRRQTLPLYVLRTTAHYPHEPQCVVLGLNKRSRRTVLFVFNPITGDPVAATEGLVHCDFTVVQAMQLPQHNSDFLRGLLMLDHQHKIHVFPSSAREVALRLAPVLFLFMTDVDTGELRGFSLKFSTPSELVAGQTWSVTFPPSEHTITNVVMKRSIEHVHSQGRVMADRSVLYKYLNPNLALVTTEDGSSLHKTTSVSVYLLDVVSGQIIFSTIHKRAKGPVQVVHSENWVVYVFNSEKSRRMEAVVLELYEGKAQSNTTAFSSLSPPPAPMVERQAYIVPSVLDAIAVTITEKGITSKHLLFALPVGGILEMPKALMDPRRSLFPSQELREEGVIPYNPELPAPTENIINYNQSVFRIRGIYTAPTGLESTSLVLAYGLDLFYTRVTPSRTFDILKDDFDHWLIVAVLSALVVASYATKVLASRKALKQAWK